MPSTYAHYRFGCRVFESLPLDIQGVISRHRGNYDIGQHGPDILFYYKPLKSNSINSQGGSMHKIKGSELFTRFAMLLNANPGDEALESYLIGFVCHYALDSHCHSYIENKIRISGIDHVSIEAAMDRYLLLQDKKAPLGESLSGHIKPGDEISRCASMVFDGVSEKDINKALKSFHFYDDLLSAKNPLIRGFITAALRVTGNYDSKHGLMMPKGQTPGTEDSDLRLSKLFDKAVKDAPDMINSFLKAAKKGEPLNDPMFSGTFGPWTGWQDIPVLSYKEEMSYEV